MTDPQKGSADPAHTLLPSGGFLFSRERARRCQRPKNEPLAEGPAVLKEELPYPDPWEHGGLRLSPPGFPTKPV